MVKFEDAQESYFITSDNQLHLPGIVSHFRYNNRECANVMEMLFNQINEMTELF